MDTIEEPPATPLRFAEVDDEAAVGCDIAAKFLGVSISALAHWRARGQGPKAIRYGRTIRYVMRELRAFRDRCEQGGAA